MMLGVVGALLPPVAPALAGAQDVADDPPTVTVDVDRSARRTLDEIVRIGSVDRPLPYRFGRVTDIEVAPEAREIFVLDGLECPDLQRLRDPRAARGRRAM